ncbi:ABC transporter ATP-binding protein [Peptoniphilus sp. MSJ-1]|uniref:ABC transporter ATP-binding protein n=1 Tax=Peptoniphilus ovalis TaxID=2841503 RepID=A0ABS6FHY4_9FIRM|nr:ABC transporter ATP-binding protein [Peptoniphilus ovalis]MBU5669792.1 ABC transporter ATP-binding protein [Peptoniphilus ovalis]
MKNSLIKMTGIKKSYNIGKPNELEILHGIDFSVNDGEFVAVVGQSGSGKSTLMNIIGLLDRQTEGYYELNGTDISTLSDAELSNYRSKKIGFVFQNFNLIARSNSIKNVELPMTYAGVPKKERTERAKELLKIVEMEERMDHLPNELSGGQKQRVAIARSMANNPDIILADEPTGALDSRTGRNVMDLFHKLNEVEKRTIIIITHNLELAEEASRIYKMADGKLEEV